MKIMKLDLVTNKGIATSNKGITTSSKKLLVTRCIATSSKDATSRDSGLVV